MGLLLMRNINAVVWSEVDVAKNTWTLKFCMQYIRFKRLKWTSAEREQVNIYIDKITLKSWMC